MATSGCVSRFEATCNGSTDGVGGTTRIRDHGVKVDNSKDPKDVINPERHYFATAASLAEFGRLTNANEENRLATTEYKDSLAYAFAD
jgi:N-acetylmuramoyl-L-alanine amidase